MNLNYHPPRWFRNLMTSSNFYRECVSRFRTLMLNKIYYNAYNEIITSPIVDERKNTKLIFMGDGRVPHGGLGDRLWGIISAFKISEDLGFDFRINQVHPFRLSTYFLPNKYNWEILPEEIKYDKTSRAFYYGENKSKLNVPKLYRRINNIGCKTYLHQIHFYNNLHFVKDFADRFQNLFKASTYLENALQNSFEKCQLKEKEYVSAVFRFQNLLGDFHEADFNRLNDLDQKFLIGRCKEALKSLYRLKSSQILVTSDSIKFLHSLNDLPFIRYVDGTLAHPDSGKSLDDPNDPFLKSFVDLIMLSKSECVFSIYSDKMYKESQFAKTAAIIGRIPHQDIFL